MRHSTNGSWTISTFTHVNMAPPRTRRGVEKWNLDRLPPNRIYLSTTAPSEFQRDIPADVLPLLRPLVEEVVAENYPDMYCGRLPIPIVESGPSIGLSRPGTIIIVFHPTHSMVSENYLDAGGYFTSLMINLNEPVWGNIDDPSISRGWHDRDQLKSTLAHEFLHTAGAFHAFGTYSDSLMGNRFDAEKIPRLSREDKLAQCLIYHSDTKPGNDSPDTNPVY